MAHIYVTRNIPDIGLHLLRAAGHEVTVHEKDAPPSHEELVGLLSQQPYNALLSLLTDTIDEAVLDAAPHLKIVSNYAVGYNNIDLAAATARGVVVTNTPGVLSDTVAEFTVALMLALLKRIPEADQFTRNGHYTGWAPELFIGSDLAGATLGIVGAGRIGTGVATRAARGFAMKVLYHDTAPHPLIEKEASAQYVPDIDTLLAQADVVSLHVPLVPETRHLINAERLGRMKPSAYLINTSRGPVIDEAALVAALKGGTLRGAALDVFEHEPALADGLSQCHNAIITPHIASASEQTRAKMSEIAAQNIIDVLAGDTPQYVVEAGT